MGAVVINPQPIRNVFFTAEKKPASSRYEEVDLSTG